MATTTVNLPHIGLEALFSFKNPFNQYVNSVLTTNAEEIKLKVLSIVSMQELIALDKVDPFTKYYIPLGISEADFKNDLNNDVPLITFLYNGTNGVKVPLSYISFYRTLAQTEYINKLVVMDLGQVHKVVSPEIYFNDIKDFIEQRIGIRPNLMEVSVGEPTLIDIVTHESLELARNNSILIHDTNETKLEKLSILYNSLLVRFNEYRLTHP